MSRIFGKIKILTDSEMERIHSTALDILASVGMIIHLREARDILGSYGCAVNDDRKVVRFPAGLVDTTVKRMRKDFLRPERAGLKQAIRYGEVSYYKRTEEIHHDFTCNAGGFCTLIYDFAGRRRRATMDDLHDSFKLINSLGDITYSGLPVSDQDTPHQLRPIRMAAELAKYTTKLGGIEAWTIDDIRYIEEIAAVVRGSREGLLKKPCLVGYAESRSPLSLDENMAALFIEFVRRGFPQSIDTMPCAGTTAPATGAGTLALGLAETLAGLVLGYAVDENAVMGIDFNGGYADMRSLLFSVGGPDRQALMGAWAQMMTSYYGITAAVHGGKTNACEPGFQAAMEKMQSVMFLLFCGASGIGTVGQVENFMTYSPVQLVLDAELVRSVRRLMAGFEVNDDTLALDVIRRVGPGGTFIADPHTAGHFREEFWLSDLAECLSWESYRGERIRGMERRAAEKVREIMSQPLEPAINDDQVREIDRIVAHAEKTLLTT